jgi:hypothetical protein
VFAAGVRHVQLEPAYGGPNDTGAELRGLCGLAFAHFGRHDALAVLAELLADPERVARLGAARGLGDAGRADAAPLLRYKLLLGDDEPEVIAACLESLLHLEDAIDFVARPTRRRPQPGIATEALRPLSRQKLHVAFC